MRAKFAGLAVIMAALLLPGVALAEPDGGSKVLATVNGHEITTDEVRLAAEDITAQLAEVAPGLRFPFTVEYLIERHLLAQAAVKEGIADSDEYKQRLAFYQAKALRDAYFATKLRPLVTEDEIRKVYDEQAAKVNSEERVRARHILVATEEEAKDIAARIAKGEDFEELAKKYSLDGSKEYGGDLGYFTAPEMVPAFSKVAFALKPGEVSDPVKTEFGWHLIKLEDRKVGGAQPYEDVKGAIRLVLFRKAVQDKMLELRKSAEIEVLDADLKKLQEKTEEIRDRIDSQLGTPGPAPDGGKADKVE